MAGDDLPVERWRGAPVEEWRARWGVPRLEIYRRIGSTNDTVKTLAGAGAPAGTVVVADEQTRGRGRRGEAWTTAPGAALLLSMLIRPADAHAPAVLPLRVGLACAGAIEAVAPVDVRIKWPNDLEIRGRKVGGVLCEATTEGGGSAFVVAGIGINLDRSDEEWSDDVRSRATCLNDEASGAVGPERLADALVPGLLSLASRPGGTLTAAEHRELGRRDALRGRQVSVDGRPAGVAAGIAADGSLRVRDGERDRTVVGGTIRTLNAREAEHS